MNATIRIGERLVHQLGFGAMRLTGHGDTSWGEPADRIGAVAVARRAVELGVDFIDTADAYGPEVSENILREALHPYDGVVIATKGGLTRGARRQAIPDGSPTHLREACEASLRRLGLERIELYQLHMVDPKVAFEDSFGTLLELQREGKIDQIGLCNVAPSQLEAALAHGRVASVQNHYSVLSRTGEDVLELCRAHDIAFIPYFPIGGYSGGLNEEVLDSIARKHGTTARQIGLAWLLQHFTGMLPIPGTSRVAHLEENVRATGIELDGDDVTRLDRLAGR